MQIEPKQQKYHVGQNLDVLDTVKKWANAEVLYCDDKEIFIHYTGWSNKYDQSINIDSPRILQQWEFGKIIQINNRIDAHHPIGGWLQARAIQKDQNNPNKIKVHFTNYHAKYDIWVDLSDHNQVSMIGSRTKAYGVGKKRAQSLKKQLSERAIKNLKEKIAKFVETMKAKKWVMKSIEGDGNCLFRSVSHQLYGNECYHKEIRELCMDYLLMEKVFFQDYILEDIQDYVKRKRNNAVWGDDVEIQAISEIYSRPIEIYAFGDRPIRTFHEENESNVDPLRLAYVGYCHYNSIKTEQGQQKGILQTPFGEYERTFLKAYQQHGQHPDNLRYRNQFSNTNRIEDTIQENVEADVRQIQQKHKEQLDKILEISETQSILEQIENAELKQIQNRTEMERIQEDLKKLEEREFQEAKNLSKQNNQVRPYWFNQIKSQGFSDQEIEFAIQIKGLDPDAVQNFLLDNM